MRRLYALVILAILAIFGCGGGGGTSSPSQSTPPTEKVLVSIAVTPANNQVTIGTTLQFNVTGTYSDNSTADLTASAVWESSATSVVTIVAASGKATAIAAGTATITATVGSLSGTTDLTVPPTRLVSIRVDIAQTSIPAGTATDLKATGLYSDSSSKILTGTVSWNSSATSVATIADAKATAVAAGQTTLTATQDGISGSATLTVTSATLQTLEVTPANTTIAAGTNQAFTATGNFSDGTSKDLSAAVTWTSSDPSVATIASDGRATAVAAGQTMISAISPLGGSIMNTTQLTVTSAVLQSITLTPADPTSSAWATRQFTVTGLFSDGSSQNLTASANWSSSEINVATIAPGGLATTVAAGTTTITAIAGGRTASTSFAVTPPIVTGTWTGKYTITGLEPGNIKDKVGDEHAFLFELIQNGSSLTGTATLRGIASGPIIEGAVTGEGINFRFTYESPLYGNVVELDSGTATITDSRMEGFVTENHINGYSMSYRFDLTKQP